MPYQPTDPLTDRPRQPDELRRLNLEQDSNSGTMWPWIVGIIAVIVVGMMVYGYNRPYSTTVGNPPFTNAPTTTGAAPAPPPEVNPLAATATPAPATPTPSDAPH